MSTMFEQMENKIKGKNRRIVFTEGEDDRILTAACKLAQNNVLIPILLGKQAEIEKHANALSLSLDNIEIICPETSALKDELVTRMVELRKGKMDEEMCKKALLQANYFGTMLVKCGYADGLLGGATYSTADTVRPALQLVKTKPGCNIVSSSFILLREDAHKREEKYVMADCAINIAPTVQELVDITEETANTAKVFGIEPIVAMLSFSSYGSGKGDSVSIVQEATRLLKEKDLSYPVDGELQFDAAFSPEVALTKAPNSPVAGKANTFIFPNIDAGNIGYKIAQRLGGFEAIGPILQGLAAPINDLSRGCNADEIYKMALVTASSV